MKIFKNITEQINKMDGKYGFVIKTYLIVTFIFFPVLLITFITNISIIFDRERWKITEFERNVNLQRARIMMIENHIRSFDDINDVRLTIVFPSEYQPFSTASLMIIPEPGSDITKNQQKINGIQKYLVNSIEGLQMEYIVIVDQEGYELNNFIH